VKSQFVSRGPPLGSGWSRAACTIQRMRSGCTRLSPASLGLSKVAKHRRTIRCAPTSISSDNRGSDGQPRRSLAHPRHLPPPLPHSIVGLARRSNRANRSMGRFRKSRSNAGGRSTGSLRTVLGNPRCCAQHGRARGRCEQAAMTRAFSSPAIGRAIQFAVKISVGECGATVWAGKERINEPKRRGGRLEVR
jgi:hypothetical protein